MPTSVDWTANLQAFVHDPDEVEDYEFDFTAWLDGDILVPASCEVESTGVDSELFAVVGDNITARISGGTVGETAVLTVRAVSSGGRVGDRSIRFQIREL